MKAFLSLFLFFCCFSSQHTVNAAVPRNCDLVYRADGAIDVNELVLAAVESGCRVIQLQPGDWDVPNTIVLTNVDDIVIQGDAGASSAILRGSASPLISIRSSSNVTLQDFVIQGELRIEESEYVTVRSMRFAGGGIVLPGRRCNQPNECTAFNRHVTIEESTFDAFDIAIQAERLETSVILDNTFRGPETWRRSTECRSDIIAIALDGITEDVDRPLEYGHNKENRVIGNIFDAGAVTAIRIRQSQGNILRDNIFVRPYRAVELLEDARYNQLLQNTITYLSQVATDSRCPKPCAFYLSPGSVNNLFTNNFFEQNFEIQFLERNRNRSFIIDESGGLNVFRSDFLKLFE